MPSSSAISFALCLLPSLLLTRLASTPPNPNPDDTKLWKQDRIASITQSRSLARRQLTFLISYIQHAFLVLTFPPPSSSSSSEDPATTQQSPPAPPICPYPSNLNASLFNWSPYTATCLFLIICIGAPLRFAAYRGLGKNFTFRLAPPDQLVTTGIYRYVQHPSYTGQMIVILNNLLLLFRWDGAFGCWVPPSIIAGVRGLGPLFFVAVFVAIASIQVVRMRDEEAMLKERFGEKWERWHRSTKRLIPGVF